MKELSDLEIGKEYYLDPLLMMKVKVLYIGKTGFLVKDSMGNEHFCLSWNLKYVSDVK